MTDTTTPDHTAELVRLRKELAAAGGMQGWRKGSDIDWRELKGRIVMESDSPEFLDPLDPELHEVRVNSVGNAELTERDPLCDAQPYADYYYLVLPQPSADAIALQSKIDALTAQGGV